MDDELTVNYIILSLISTTKILFLSLSTKSGVANRGGA